MAAEAPTPAPPTLAPTPEPPLQNQLLGWAPGQAPIAPTDAPGGTKRAVAASATVIPELGEAEVKPRPLWRHPAMLVSMILTFIALVVAGVLIVLSIVNGGAARVTGLELELGEGNAHLTWSAPDTEVDLYVVTGGDALDLSQRVRGEEAWLPVALGLFGDDSCFVVRPAERSGDPISLVAEDLEAQGAQSACVADVS